MRSYDGVNVRCETKRSPIYTNNHFTVEDKKLLDNIPNLKKKDGVNVSANTKQAQTSDSLVFRRESQRQQLADNIQRRVFSNIS